VFPRLLGAIALAVTLATVQLVISDASTDEPVLAVESDDSQPLIINGSLLGDDPSPEARLAVKPTENPGRGRGRDNPRAVEGKASKTATALSTTTTLGATTSTLGATTSTRAVNTTATTAQPTTDSSPATTSPPTTIKTSPPGSGPRVDVFPGESIQAVVDANPAGTTFYLRAGVHSGQSIKPRDGDKFIGESGAILDGRGNVEYAFKSTAGNVLIQNLTIENYATPAKWGAVAGGGTGWTVRDNEVHHNWGAGIDFGSGYRVIGNNVHHNRQIGIKGHGSGVLVEGNEIAFNNYRDDYSYGWEAGGTKFLKTTNLVVRNNYVHDNHGSGLWADHNNIGTIYEGNTVINNYGPGIFHEISYDAVIRNNRIEGNAFKHSKAGIKISSSSNVEIYGNTLKNNNGGIYASQKNRGSGSHGTFEIKNLWVHDNTITFSSGFHGFRVHDGGDAYYNNKNNRFDRNNYNVHNSEPFFWMGDRRSAEEWKSFGQDPNGTIN